MSDSKEYFNQDFSLTRAVQTIKMKKIPEKVDKNEFCHMKNLDYKLNNV